MKHSPAKITATPSNKHPLPAAKEAKLLNTQPDDKKLTAGLKRYFDSIDGVTASYVLGYN